MRTEKSTIIYIKALLYAINYSGIRMNERLDAIDEYLKSIKDNIDYFSYNSPSYFKCRTKKIKELAHELKTSYNIEPYQDSKGVYKTF